MISRKALSGKKHMPASRKISVRNVSTNVRSGGGKILRVTRFTNYSNHHFCGLNMGNNKPQRVLLEINGEIVYDEYVPRTGINAKIMQLRGMGSNSASYAIYVQCKSRANSGRRTPFTNEDVAIMKQMHSAGKSYKVIGQRFSCTGECIGRHIRDELRQVGNYC